MSPCEMFIQLSLTSVREERTAVRNSESCIRKPRELRREQRTDELETNDLAIMLPDRQVGRQVVNGLLK